MPDFKHIENICWNFILSFDVNPIKCRFYCFLAAYTLNHLANHNYTPHLFRPSIFLIWHLMVIGFIHLPILPKAWNFVRKGLFIMSLIPFHLVGQQSRTSYLSLDFFQNRRTYMIHQLDQAWSYRFTLCE